MSLYLVFRAFDRRNLKQNKHTCSVWWGSAVCVIVWELPSAAFSSHLISRYLKCELSFSSPALQTTRSPVSEVTDKIRVVHLQLFFGNILSKVHGWTVEEVQHDSALVSSDRHKYDTVIKQQPLTHRDLLFALLTASLYCRVCRRCLHQQIIPVVIGQEDVSRFLSESRRECGLRETPAFMSHYDEVELSVSVLTLDKGGPLYPNFA